MVRPVTPPPTTMTSLCELVPVATLMVYEITSCLDSVARNLKFTISTLIKVRVEYSSTLIITLLYVLTGKVEYSIYVSIT